MTEARIFILVEQLFPAGKKTHFSNRKMKLNLIIYFTRYFEKFLSFDRQQSTLYYYFNGATLLFIKRTEFILQSNAFVIRNSITNDFANYNH